MQKRVLCSDFNLMTELSQKIKRAIGEIFMLDLIFRSLVTVLDETRLRMGCFKLTLHF